MKFTSARRRAGAGFTLIELLIVVAIIGIIAAILIPNLLDALQKAKQKRTVGDMRSVGAAWFSWLTDQIGAAAAGASSTNQNIYDMTVFTHTLDGDGLLSTLYNPNGIFYIQEVPSVDGWGGAYTYLHADSPLDRQYMAIWSGGRDNGPGGNEAPANSYVMGPFIATDYDQDIVWADGFFVSYPAGVQVQ